MRIAQIAPLAESVPPKLYGGTECVVAWLVDELVKLGHDITLFPASFTPSGHVRCASGAPVPTRWRQRLPCCKR
jgi:hypothetical protein